MSVQTSRFENSWSEIITNMSNGHPLEVVSRGSERKLQVGIFLCRALRVGKLRSRHRLLLYVN